MTGGFVYRGSRLGAPIAGDIFLPITRAASGRSRSPSTAPARRARRIAASTRPNSAARAVVGLISSFGVDADGELYHRQSFCRQDRSHHRAADGPAGADGPEDHQARSWVQWVQRVRESGECEGAARTRKVALVRALSKLGYSSRSQAYELIRTGKVEVNGRVVTDPARLVAPGLTRIQVAGIEIDRAPWLCIALNKPRGVVTSRTDPEGRQTVYDLISDLDARVVPVGRLDLASTGLLLMTNDTHLADWLTDPAAGIACRYVVTVRGELSDTSAASLTKGIVDRGETLEGHIDRHPKEVEARDAHHCGVDGREEPRDPSNVEGGRARGNAPQAYRVRRRGARRPCTWQVAQHFPGRSPRCISPRTRTRAGLKIRAAG